jgi:hypothetical protein
MILSKISLLKWRNEIWLKKIKYWRFETCFQSKRKHQPSYNSVVPVLYVLILDFYRGMYIYIFFCFRVVALSARWINWWRFGNRRGYHIHCSWQLVTSHTVPKPQNQKKNNILILIIWRVSAHYRTIIVFLAVRQNALWFIVGTSIQISRTAFLFSLIYCRSCNTICSCVVIFDCYKITYSWC